MSIRCAKSGALMGEDLFTRAFIGAAGLSFHRRWGMKQLMEKIDPQPDYERIKRFAPGQRITFEGKPYTVQRRTTLASGEAAVVLQNEREQFVVGAAKFLAGVE